MPVDKFGNEIRQRTSTAKSDEGISLNFANKTYIRIDGESDITGNLNMALRKIENLGKPTNPKDATSKEYVDNTKGTGVIGEVKDETATLKGNLDFEDRYRIKNLPAPADWKDAVNMEYVERLAINHPFEFKENKYQAKTDLYLQGNKIQGVGTPFNDGDVVTKGYVESVSAPLLKLEEGEYKTRGDIDMSKTYTICNIKPPVKDEQITDKKYVDDQFKIISAFKKRNGGYEASENIYMRRNKILGLRDPLQDGEAVNKKYVDGIYNNLLNQFVDADDNILPGKNVDMEGNQILNLPEPKEDEEAATKKYVDDLQTQHVDEKGNVKFGRNVNLDNKRIFAMKEPSKPNEGANKKYVDDTIKKRIQEEKDTFLPQDAATKHYVDEAIRGIAAGDVLVSKEGVFIKENGHYRATAPLDIDNQKMENIPDPVDPKDAVNKKYIDDSFKNLTLKQGLVRENGGFNLVDSYINMNFNRIRNIPIPKDISDAVPRSFVENSIKDVDEKIKKIKERINEERPFFKENGNYQALANLNMGFKRLLNIAEPIDPYEVARKDYVDSYFDETKKDIEKYKEETKKEVDEFFDTTQKDIEEFKELTRQQLELNEDIITNRILQFKQIITVSAEFRGNLNEDEPYFSFYIHSLHSNKSFTVPVEGKILKIKTHTKRYAISFLEGRNFDSTPVGYDIENENLNFSLHVDDEEKFLISNQKQGSSTTTLINPLPLQPDDEIKLICLSNVPIRIIGFIVLVIELNI